MLGLYLHIPFCSAICNYCNFNRGLLDEGLKARYVRALAMEIDQVGREGGPVPSSQGRAADTLYFGGGTPSLLSAQEVATLITAAKQAFDVAANAEITLEANPETVTTEKLAAFREAGVNRISFGVQSFRDDELRRLTRLHGVERARAAYGEARTAGFDNVSLDLMMWLPGQQVSDWIESVDGAIALAPEHLSLYMLEVYPNSPLREDMARARWSQAPDEDVAAMYSTAMERLEADGYSQYEISNVARPGRQSRHNLKYWTDGEWFGFGCGAHSTVGGVRWKNLAGTDEYVIRVAAGQSPAGEMRRMTADERLGDALFTALRLSEGADIAAINRRYAVDAWARFGQDLRQFVDAGLLEITESQWRLTRPGMLLAHEVMAVFV